MSAAHGKTFARASGEDSSVVLADRLYRQPPGGQRIAPAGTCDAYWRGLPGFTTAAAENP